MPTWAKGEDADELLWKMADEHERANGRLALKVVLAIPRDIPRDRWADLTKDICFRQFYGHPLSWAIHEGQASDGKTNPHIHVLVSERALDGVSRPPEQFFKRANSKNPSAGGAAKDRRWHDKGFFHEVRKSWADVCNEFLLAAEAQARVDHRSNRFRGISKPPGVHEGPARLAMKARGVQVRQRHSRIHAREIAAENQRERRRLESEIHGLEQIERILSMPVNKPSTSERDNLPPARIAISGRKCTPHQPEDVREYVTDFFDALGFDVIWASAPNPQNSSGHRLFGWRAIDRNDPTRQVMFDGNDTFTASQEDDASLMAIVEGLKAAGFKAAILSGSDKAISRMAELCRLNGIRVENKLPETDGFGTPPLPPPQPPTAAPKPQKSKREIERINLNIAREFWPQADYRLPALKRRSKGQAEPELPGREPHELARSAGQFDHVEFMIRTGQMQTASGLLEAGIARTTFHLVREQGFALDRIHCDQLHSANRQDGGPPKLSPKLCKALRKSAELTGVPLPAELDTAISKAEAEHAKAKEQKQQLEKDQNKTREVTIELEPE